MPPTNGSPMRLISLARFFTSSREHPGRTLDGFLDSLLQGFENCREGVSDATLRAGPGAVEPYFANLYENEFPRLRETIALQEPTLSAREKEDFLRKIDVLIRTVVIPAYARIALRFTLRERNDFYLTPSGFHGLERVGWGVAGFALGAFVVWAPFIPLWSKEWMAVFALGGLVFPNLRRYLALRRYQADLNRLVVRADDEIWRMELSYLMSGRGIVEETVEPETHPSKVEVTPRASEANLARPPRKVREGER